MLIRCGRLACTYTVCAHIEPGTDIENGRMNANARTCRGYAHLDERERKQGTIEKGGQRIFFLKLYNSLISQPVMSLPWCSGYHVRLTRERSLVRARPGVCRQVLLIFVEDAEACFFVNRDLTVTGPEPGLSLFTPRAPAL